MSKDIEILEEQSQDKILEEIEYNRKEMNRLVEEITNTKQAERKNTTLEKAACGFSILGSLALIGSAAYCFWKTFQYNDGE